MANTKGGLRRSFARVDATGRGRQNLAQRDLLAGYVLGPEVIQIGAHEAAEKRGGDVVGVTL